MQINRTGQKMPFLDVSIGSIYFAHGQYWTRTDYDAGSVLTGSEERLGNCCNFLIDGTVRSRDGVTCEEVEIVTVINEREE